MKRNTKANDEIATGKLEAREWFLSHKEVPTVTDMRRELGTDLANVLIGNFDAITKQIMLIRDDADNAKPPMVKMNIPVKVTHQDICDRGEIIEQKIIKHMLHESLAEQLLILKREFCEDLHQREEDLYQEYDQLKQDVLTNMKYLFECDERDFIQCHHERRIKTAEVIVNQFEKVKPLVMTAVAVRVQKIIDKHNAAFLKQRCREQLRVYQKLRDAILTESHAKNKKFMIRIFNEFGASLADEIQTIRGVLLINNLQMILEQRLKFQTQLEDLKKKLKDKLRCVVNKCEKLLNKPLKAKKQCPNVELWRQKCLWLIDNYETFIETTTNQKKGHGRFFLNIERLIENFESITQHDHGFYQCSYESGGIIEYFDRAKQELIDSPHNLPAVTQEIRPKIRKTSATKVVTDNIPPFAVKGCYKGKAETIQQHEIFKYDESDSSISSIEYNGKTYASNKSYNRVATRLFPPTPGDEGKTSKQARIFWGDKGEDNIEEDEPSAENEVVDIALRFREELLNALDLSELGKHIFNIIIDSTSKVALLQSTATIEERNDDHGTLTITPVFSAYSNELRADSINFLSDVEKKFEKCINKIITPTAIIDFIRKIEQAKTVKRRRLYRARDSIMLTEKKMKLNKMYRLDHRLQSSDNFDVESNETITYDYNPPVYFHQNCLDFHYEFNSFLDKINSMVEDDVEIPIDTKTALEVNMRMRAQLKFVDLVKDNLKNTRVLRRVSQKFKRLERSILKTQNHFKTRENIDENILKMEIEKLVELVEKVIVK